MADGANPIPDDLRAAIRAFQRHCGSVVMGPYMDALNAAEPPDIVYHYTSAAGLKGILESGTLWLSDVFRQNDPSELRHGVLHALALLQRACREDRPEIAMFHDKVKGTLGTHIEEAILMMICCFSGNGDDLGQWRAYADDGKGFAIGFDASILRYLFMTSQGDHGNLNFLVDYDQATLGRVQSQIVQAVLPLISMPSGRNLPEPLLAAYMRHLSVEFSNQITCSAVFFKHAAYIQEQEYRLLRVFPVYGDKPHACLTRQSAGTAIRYVTLPWRAVSRSRIIREIVVGPAADRRFADECLRTICPDLYNLATIRSSAIPYRSMR